MRCRRDDGRRARHSAGRGGGDPRRLGELCGGRERRRRRRGAGAWGQGEWAMRLLLLVLLLPSSFWLPLLPARAAACVAQAQLPSHFRPTKLKPTHQRSISISSRSSRAVTGRCGSWTGARQALFATEHAATRASSRRLWRRSKRRTWTWTRTRRCGTSWPSSRNERVVAHDAAHQSTPHQMVDPIVSVGMAKVKAWSKSDGIATWAQNLNKNCV